MSPSTKPVKSQFIRLLCDPPLPGPMNMAADEALMVNSPYNGFPTLRLYSFWPPCISLGRFQEFPGTIDVEECRRRGIDMVRRPTGGLAILHMDEITYSFTAFRRSESQAFDQEIFRQVSLGITESLKILGIHARVVAREGKSRRCSPWCFESVTGVDVEWNGKKICGSAQMVRKGCILQHGTVFLKYPGILISDVTVQAGKAGGCREHYRTFASIEEAAGNELPPSLIRAALMGGFSEAFDSEVECGEYTEDEKALRESLLRSKYESVDWLERGDILEMGR